MKCPNCGAKLKEDVYRNYPKKGQLAFLLYCENEDFGTDYTTPSKAVAEVESAYRWNETLPKGE